MGTGPTEPDGQGQESGSALRAESLDRADATESRATESPGSDPSALNSPPLFQPLPLAPPVPIGLVVEMDLPELGLTDLAWVTDISDCPKIEPVDSQHSRHGRVVTATFHHSSGDVIDLVMRDSDLHPSAPSLLPSEETIGTTSNHPFWSVDRQEYVQAGQLDTGERVLTFSGDTKRVVTKLPRPGPQPVYNLEVHAEHVYFVGEDGLLVHNAKRYSPGDVSTGKGRTSVTYQGTKIGTDGVARPYTGYASAPSDLNLSAAEIISRRYSGDFSDFGGVATTAVYTGLDEIGKQTARGLEQHFFNVDVRSFGRSNVANRQRPVGSGNARRAKYLDAARKELARRRAN